MTATKSPSIDWPAGPLIGSTSEHELPNDKDLVREALDELDDIVKAAGGFPAEPPADAAMSPPLDPATAELLTPAGTPPSPEEALQKALQDGTIPSFPELPADRAVDPNAPALDPAAEREAWQSLIAFINAHKDPGTVVTIVDPDTFIAGL